MISQKEIEKIINKKIKAYESYLEEIKKQKEFDTIKKCIKNSISEEILKKDKKAKLIKIQNLIDKKLEPWRPVTVK